MNSLERLLKPLALDGVANGPRGLPSISLAFDQVVLNPVTHRFETDPFILDPGQHHNGQMGRRGARLEKRVPAGAVRQRQVQQQSVELSALQAFDRVRPAADMGELVTFKSVLNQGFLQQRGIRQAVFHQEDFYRRLVHDSVRPAWPAAAVFAGRAQRGGSVTTNSQNDSMDRTTVRNCWKSTGLVM